MKETPGKDGPDKGRKKDRSENNSTKEKSRTVL